MAPNPRVAGSVGSGDPGTHAAWAAGTPEPTRRGLRGLRFGGLTAPKPRGAGAWAAGLALQPTRGPQRKLCSPRTRAAWLRGSPPKPRCFGGFIFGGFAGRQSEVLSVLGVSASSLPASVACPLSLCFPSLARARARSLCARKSACECVWVRFCACLWRGAFASARVPTTRPMRCRSYLPSRPTPLCTL